MKSNLITGMSMVMLAGLIAPMAFSGPISSQVADNYGKLDDLRRENLDKDQNNLDRISPLVADNYGKLDDLRRENLDKDQNNLDRISPLVADNYDKLDDLRRENLDKDQNSLNQLVRIHLEA